MAAEEGAVPMTLLRDILDIKATYFRHQVIFWSISGPVKIRTSCLNHILQSSLSLFWGGAYLISNVYVTMMRSHMVEIFPLSLTDTICK